jgi:hypothetical protein
MQFGQPLLAASGNAPVPGQQDLLLNPNTGAIGGAITLNYFVAAQNPYVGIGIINPDNVPNVVDVTATNQNSGLWSSCAVPHEPGVIGVLYLPLLCAKGDSIEISLCINAASGGGIFDVVGLTGVTEMAINANFRPDGRAFPLGVRIAQSTVAGAIVTAQANNRIYVHTLSLSTSGGGSCAIAGTINGVVVNILTLASAGAVSDTFPQGILFDPNTAVSLGIAGAAAVTGAVIYDRVHI